MRPDAGTRTWATLAEVPETADPFDPDTTAGLPDPARRFLLRALPPGTPLAGTVVLDMEGHIRLAGRWLAFRAEQIIRAGVGFVWRPTVGGRIIRFEGADLLGPDAARMDFRFQGLIPVVRATGPDVARSAAGRLAAETVVWIPQALSPQAGARWHAVDDERAVVTLDGPDAPVEVEITVGDDGRLQALALRRWNSSATPPGPETFGGRIDDEHVTSAGVHIAGSGTVGWGWATPSWPGGEFFRFRITAARPAAPR